MFIYVLQICAIGSPYRLLPRSIQRIGPLHVSFRTQRLWLWRVQGSSKQSDRLPLFNLAALMREHTAWQIHCNLVSICDYSFPTTMGNLVWQFLCMLFSCVLLGFGWWGKFAARHVHICCFNRRHLEKNFIPGCARLCSVCTYFTPLAFTGSVELGGDSLQQQQQQQQAGGPQHSTAASQPRNDGKNRFLFDSNCPHLLRQ